MWDGSCGRDPHECSRVRCHVPNKCCGVDVDGDAFKSAATQQPECVTVEEFAQRMRGEVVLDGQYSHCYGRDIARVFPHGIKIVEG